VLQQKVGLSGGSHLYFVSPTKAHDGLWTPVFPFLSVSAVTVIEYFPFARKYFKFFFFFFGGIGVLTQGLALARQVFYHLSHGFSSLFFS
jgi:hypothetical protein